MILYIFYNDYNNKIDLILSYLIYIYIFVYNNICQDQHRTQHYSPADYTNHKDVRRTIAVDIG